MLSHNIDWYLFSNYFYTLKKIFNTFDYLIKLKWLNLIKEQFIVEL